MPTKTYISWGNDDFTWDSEIRLWEEVYDIVGELVGSGARDPQYWGDGYKENGTFGLDYDGILALTVKSLQEANAKIEQLENRIIQLENK